MLYKSYLRSSETFGQLDQSPSGASAAAVSVVVLQEVLPECGCLCQRLEFGAIDMRASAVARAVPRPCEVVSAVHSGQPESFVGDT